MRKIYTTPKRNPESCRECGYWRKNGDAEKGEDCIYREGDPLGLCGADSVRTEKEVAAKIAKPTEEAKKKAESLRIEFGPTTWTKW